MKALKILISFLLVFEILGKADNNYSLPTDLENLYEQVNSGDSYAQALLAICLRSGEFGLKVDLELARKWTLHAINSDEPLAHYNLANISMMAGNYEKATQDYKKAKSALLELSSKGDAVAKYALVKFSSRLSPLMSLEH